MTALQAAPSYAFNINDHKLTGDDVSFTPSPNSSGMFEKGYPDTIVIHFTAGSNLASSVNVLTHPDSGVSAHFAVGRNGNIVQMLPTNQIAWHAGESHFEGRSGLNQYSIGIELDNAGQLKERSDGTYESWFGKVYEKSEVFEVRNNNQYAIGYWHKYSDIQVARTLALCKALCEHYQISTIVGHEEIAPTRKVDPGPAFPLQKFKELASHPERNGWEAELKETSTQREAHDQFQRDLTSPIKKIANVSASTLNVRKGPGASFPTIDNGLNKGEILKVLEKQGDWAKVSFTKVGWVNTAFIHEVTEKSPFKS